MPIFRPGPGPYALAVAMTAIRMGERLLGIGSGTPDLFGALAVKVGLSGQAAAVSDEERGAEALRQAAARAGALADVAVTARGVIPHDRESFDLVVLDCTAVPAAEAADWLGDALRVLRIGGRLIITERAGASRLARIFGRRSPSTGGEATVHLLETHGLKPARVVAQREGWRFTEGLKR